MASSPPSVASEQPTAAPGAPGEAAAEWAAYLCVAPLVLGLAGVGLAADYPQRELAQHLSIAWGAVLLAFTGAVHWGLALGGRLPWALPLIGGALAPAAVGAAAVLLGGQRGLFALAVGFGVLWLYEHRVLGARLPPRYLAMRRQLSIAILAVLAFTLFASDSAGLN